MDGFDPYIIIWGTHNPSDTLSGLQPPLPLPLREPLNRISQHGSGHDAAMGLQEVLQRGQISLPDFAQHPAGGFVDEVFFVVQENFSELKRVSNLPLADEVQSSNDSDAPFPEALRADKLIEQFLIAMMGEEVGPDNVWGAIVNSVPGADEAEIAYIETEDLFLLLRAAFFITPAENGIGQ